MTQRVLIKNISILAGVYDENPGKVSGAAMKSLPVLKDAWLAIENGVIADYGTMETWGGISDWTGLEVIDAGEGAVLPAWCDSHTHLVFAATREEEFVHRINGLSYEEIAKRGGGILNSADKMAAIDEYELFEQSRLRLNEVMHLGTGAIEIKSGYGLDLESELKMLRVIRQLRDAAPIPVKSTFLGAHTIPRRHLGNRDAYIKELIDVIIPEVGKQQLADYCDVFCERNYFSEDETVRILEAAAKYGMKAKVHANQLSKSGGVQAGVRTNAISVDHLEYMGDEEIALLKNSSTMPVLLPGAAFFLSLPWPPAREMIDSGLSVAVASDYNPGSCPSGNMNQMLSFLCVAQRMTPEEAIHAATINGAYAMNLDQTLGSITPGKQANLIITHPVKNLAAIPYHFGSNPVAQVLVNGMTI
jgi:imidazolonepropionase